jgi:small-conductance mechanosensitive channel
MLAEGHEVQIRMKGHSMRPLLRNERDIAVLTPIAKYAPAPVPAAGAPADPVPETRAADGNASTARQTRLSGDTTRPQLEKLMADLDAMLKASPDTYEDTAFVRMTGFGDSSINLMVSAYLRTADYGVFLRMQNDLNLNIMDVMKADGVDFAFPSTTVYLAKEN